MEIEIVDDLVNRFLLGEAVHEKQIGCRGSTNLSTGARRDPSANVCAFSVWLVNDVSKS